MIEIMEQVTNLSFLDPSAPNYFYERHKLITQKISEKKEK